jgi:uncharacterized protein (DUF302 family)
VTLPVDPAALDAADVGERRARPELPHDEAVDQVRETFVDAGFGVATEFSPADLLNEQIGADRDPYAVIGACNPEMADRALDDTDDRIGALSPCNVVWEAEPAVQTVYHVSIVRVARPVGLAPDDEAMAEIVADTGKLVDAPWLLVLPRPVALAVEHSRLAGGVRPPLQPFGQRALALLGPVPGRWPVRPPTGVPVARPAVAPVAHGPEDVGADEQRDGDAHPDRERDHEERERVHATRERLQRLRTPEVVRGPVGAATQA